VGTGVEHSGAGLKGGETRDRGCKTAAQGDSDMSTAVKDGGSGETACLGLGWGELGHMGSERGRGVNGGHSWVQTVLLVVWLMAWGGRGTTSMSFVMWQHLWGACRA
jgi:hypothetical protein